MPAVSASKYLVQATWDDVPHLPDKAKADMLAGTPPYLREARAAGIPSLGSGSIYPIPREEVEEEPFVIPPYWPRCYALDVGWNRTAAVWGAYEAAGDKWHLYTEHYLGKREPSVHATAIKARGEWIPGLIDPAARGRTQDAGKQLIVTYGELGLKLEPYINAVDAGLYETWMRLSTGRLKVFKTLQWWWKEYRFYRRDEDGDVVKKDDHLMDATRGLIMSGRARAIVKPLLAGQTVSPSLGDPQLGF